MTASEGALIVPIPQAEAAVGRWRAELDPASGWGVPAHVTVTYPFQPPSRLQPEELERLAEALEAVPAFDVDFRRVAWFGEGVLWLAPEPDVGFRALTAAVLSAFPDWPPYGGAYPDTVPHLTIGDGVAPARMHAAAAAVAELLPISAEVRAVLLCEGMAEPDAWRGVRELPLR